MLQNTFDNQIDLTDDQKDLRQKIENYINALTLSEVAKNFVFQALVYILDKQDSSIFRTEFLHGVKAELKDLYYSEHSPNSSTYFRLTIKPLLDHLTGVGIDVGEGLQVIKSIKDFIRKQRIESMLPISESSSPES